MQKTNNKKIEIFRKNQTIRNTNSISELNKKQKNATQLISNFLTEEYL